MRIRPTFVTLLACSLWAAGCGGDAATGDDFVDAIPSEAMLELAVDEESTATALTTPDPSRLQERAREIASRSNTAMKEAHARLRQALAGVEPTELQVGGLTCKQWQLEREGVELRVRSCQLERLARRFMFSLQARTAGSTDEGAWRVLAAGRGRVLDAVDGERRGGGVVGFDFDNAYALFGHGPQGKVSYGYRAAGELRQLHLGLQQFQAEGAEEATTARHHFMHLRGRGGVLRFGRVDDFVARGSNDELTAGTDGVDEVGRIALAWARERAARIVASVCGGTVGEGQCVRMKQCFRNGQVTMEQTGIDSAQGPEWQATACPDMPIPVELPPAEGDLEAPDDVDGEIPGPDLDEPAAEPTLE